MANTNTTRVHTPRNGEAKINTRKSRKHKRNQKRNSRGSGCLAVILGVLVVLAVAFGAAYHFFGPTKEPADIESIYGAESENGAKMYLNYQQAMEEAIYKDGEFYLPFAWVLENLNDRFYYEEDENAWLYTLPTEVKRYEASDEGRFIRLDLVEEYTNARFIRIEDEVKRLFIQTEERRQVAEVKKKTPLRVRGGHRSNVQTVCQKGEKLVILETLENWARVASDRGFIGYVPVKALGEEDEEVMPVMYSEPVYNQNTSSEKVTLAWHQITNKIGNDTLESFTKDTKGINVIAPTWFVLSDNEGSFISFSSKDYVDKAHAKGMKVWAVIDNFSNDVTVNVQSEVVLSHAEARNRIIEGLMAEADAVGFDGINLDFEGLKEAAGVHYVQFIRELGIRCREKGLTLSVDDYVPAPFNRFYNLKEQGKMCDYVVIMAYDEHYAGGEEGSVSSISYVRDGINNTLKEVPAGKVICGLPVYTRIWTVNGTAVSSQAVGMQSAASWVNKNSVELIWDDDCGQYYGEKDTSEGIKMVWLEDEKSLTLKMDAVKKADIAGAAIWKLNMETPAVWDILAWE